MLSLLKNKNFFLLFTGTFVSNIGTMFYNFAIGWFILSLTQSPFQAGLYIAVGSVLQLISTPLAGVIIDRVEKVKILVATDAIRGVVVLLAGWFIFTLDGTTSILFILYGVTVILAINGAFFSPAAMAIIPEIVVSEKLNEANAFFSFIRSFQTIIGVLLAGILYTLVGIEVIFLINGISFIISAISEYFITSTRTHNIISENPSFMGEFIEGLKYIKSKHGFISFLVVILFLNFALSPFFANLMPVFFNLEMNKEPIHLSGVQIAFSIGSMIGGVAVGMLGSKLKVLKTLRRGISLTLLLVGILGLLMHFTRQQQLDYTLFYVFFTVGALLLAFVNMFVNIPLQTSLMRIIDANVRGRVMAVLDTLTQGLIPLAVVLTGLLLEYLSISVVLVIIFIVMSVPYLVLMRSAKLTELLTSF